MELEITNISDSPITIAEYTTSTLTFIPQGGSATAPAAYQQTMQVSPSGAIQPGQTQKVTFKIDGNALVEEHLVPTSESQLTMAGLVVFKDSTGKESSVEIEEPLRPRFKD